MKIAFVTLPSIEEYQHTRIMPPLPLAYMAALLEQQRHIIRVYDLALTPMLPLSSALAPLRSFRPHLIVVASAQGSIVAQVESALQGCSAQIMHLGTSLREQAPAQAVTQALWHSNEREQLRDEQTVIFEALLALNDDVDSLPFPARHLLSLEQYSLFTLAGELQTNVLLAQQLSAYDIVVRQISHVIAELQIIAREHGIRHFVFPFCPIASHAEWLNDMLDQLIAADMDIAWECWLDYQHLDSEWLNLFRRAGCETLGLEFTAGDVLSSRETRQSISMLIDQAHELGISVRARVQLEPLFSTVPAVVDLSATLNLDDIEFSVCRERAVGEPTAVDERITLDDVTEMARSRYRSSRSRQFFIERFGPQIGPMLWRVGRSGLLGRTWWRYANGGEDSALVY